MLALTQVTSRHHQQHSADGGKNRDAILEQLAGTLEQRCGPPGAAEHDRYEERDGGELAVDTQYAAQLDRNGRDPNDQWRINLHHVDVELATGQPTMSDIEQPGYVVLQRRTQ